jgi:hypothetical protein
MNKEQFFAAVAAEVKEVEVKALGAVLRFKVLTGEARDKFHELMGAGDKSASHFEASIVAATVVNEDGSPMFSSEDVATLKASSATAVAEVAKVAMDVNRIGVSAEEQAVKN